MTKSKIKILSSLVAAMLFLNSVSPAFAQAGAGSTAGDRAAKLEEAKAKLETMRAKIAADTDLETLKADQRSIAESYRIFALIMPQAAILVAADRIKVIADNLITIGGKLESRINEAKNSGKDVASLELLLADYKAEIANAISKADAAIKAAKENIRKGMEDLRAAREDARKIVQGLKSIGAAPNASASSTVPRE